MLSEKDHEFLVYWEENRIKEKSIIRQFFPGLPIGLSLAAAILLLLDSGWYERADMVAQSESSPMVIFIAIAGIVAFTGVFYKKFRWEMNEQAYEELLLKKEQEEEARLIDSEKKVLPDKE
jgi:Tfp pilus assembly protein PilN